MQNINLHILFVITLLCSCSKSKTHTFTTKKNPESDTEEPTQYICPIHDSKLKHIEGYSPVYLPPNYIFNNFLRSQSTTLPHIKSQYISEISQVKLKKIEKSLPGFMKESNHSYCVQCSDKFASNWDKFKQLNEDQKNNYLKNHPPKEDPFILELIRENGETEMIELDLEPEILEFREQNKIR